MRTVIRVAIYALVIFGAYKFFNWFRSEDDHSDRERVEVHVDIDEAHESHAEAAFRKMPAFSAVKLSGAYEVELRHGDTYSVELETTEKVLQNIETFVEDGELIVRNKKKGNWMEDADIDIRITSPAYKRIGVSGAVKLDVHEPMETESLILHVSGAASVEMGLQVQELDMHLSGGANVELAGAAQMVNFDVSGAGHVDAEELLTQHARIGLSGAGAISVHAEETLDVRISGAGSVTYSGSPAVTKKVSGIGIIRRAAR